MKVKGIFMSDAFITKRELKKKLLEGAALDDILEPQDGQECVIYKSVDWALDQNSIVYIPDYELNEIDSHERNLNSEEIENILSNCYTKGDFLTEAFQNERCAEGLWHFCDWQNPSAGMQDMMECDGDEAEKLYGESFETMKLKLENGKERKS